VIESSVGTPRLILDLARLERNIVEMARRVESRQAVLRPHFKTHKSPEVLRRQIAAGAIGVTVATIHEAKVAIGAGAKDVLIAHPPVGREKLEAIARLDGRARLIVACSEPEHVRALSSIGRQIDYYWEVDSGAARLGTPPGPATAEAVQSVVDLPNVKLVGVMTFSGHAYAAHGTSELERVAADEADALRETARALAARGIAPGVLSGGSTPLAKHGDEVASEYRYGTYVFYDATQVALGSATLDDCALTVEATVIGRPSREHLILDAGSKSLASERMSPATQGLGVVRDHPELMLERLYEEHGVCTVTGTCELALGDRVEVIPNHACVCANLHAFYAVRTAAGVTERWPVVARGWEHEPHLAAAQLPAGRKDPPTERDSAAR
jgi:D-serine deaminase-like pyridoxal phosphate-dependent protein